MRDFWPAAAHGAIIITTRNQNIIQPPISKSIRLRSFTTEEGSRFILENIPATGANLDETPDSEHARHIAEACGGLALALSQVVRYIRTFNISLADAKRLCSTPENLVDANSQINLLSQPDFYHHLSISSLWEQSLQSLSPECSTLIHLAAHLDPDRINDAIFRHDSTTIIGYPNGDEAA
jgi:hypothetical protein